jgi:DNA primase
MKKKRLGKLTLQKDIFDTAIKDNLKSTVDITVLFNHFGVKLTQKGKSYVALCPWHDDKTPSLSVDKIKGLYNCFGCGESGDIFTLTEKMKGIDFSKALEYLKQFQGSVPILSAALPPEKQSPQNKPVLVNKNTKSEPKEQADVNASKLEPAHPKESISLTNVADYYHKGLLASAKAQEYLSNRGISNETISRFKIGFSDGSLLDKTGKESFKALQTCGSITDKGYEFFKSCVVVPLIDLNGQTLSFYGRAVGERSRTNHLYMSGEHKAVFNEKAYQVYEELILTESIIDALSLISIGLQNVSCAYGTQGLTKLHLEKLKEHSVRTVILAFDHDEPGKVAVDKYKELLVAEGFTVKVITPGAPSDRSLSENEGRPSPPEKGGEVYKDWNDMIVAGVLNKDELLSQIEKADQFKQTINGRSFRRSSDGLVLEHDEIKYTAKSESAGYKQSVRCECGDDIFYDRVDLYSSRSRISFSNSVAKLFDIPARQIEKDLIALLEYLEDEKSKAETEEENAEIILTEEDKALGLSFLTNENMFDEIVNDSEILGYVGEGINKQLMYLAATSRLLDDPISILILSESGSGKSYLVNTIKKLIPPEDVIDATSLSDQALNYMGDLLHKFLVLSEAVHKDVVEHQLREIASEKKLTRLVVKKDERSGKMSTERVTADAIVSMVMSSTNFKVNPENASRSFIINADETGEQTHRIYKSQSQENTFARHRAKTDDIPHIIRKHHTAQRMLKNYIVISHFDISDYFPKTKMRFRRDHKRFHDLIIAVCFLRQYQKQVKEKDGYLYIECDFTDYEIARVLLLKGILSNDMDDFSSGDRRLLKAIQDMVKKKANEQSLKSHEVRFIQKDIREFSDFGHEVVKKHMRKLVEYEYLEVLSGRSSGTRFSYRLRDSKDLEQLRESIIPTAEELRQNMKNQSDD